jgi:hypothetical protein
VATNWAATVFDSDQQIPPVHHVPTSRRHDDSGVQSPPFPILHVLDSGRTAQCVVWVDTEVCCTDEQSHNSHNAIDMLRGARLVGSREHDTSDKSLNCACIRWARRCPTLFGQHRSFYGAGALRVSSKTRGSADRVGYGCSLIAYGSARGKRSKGSASSSTNSSCSFRYSAAYSLP